MKTPSPVKLSVAAVCLALACVGPASQAKSRTTQPAPDSTGLLDGSLLDTHSPLGSGHGPHHGQNNGGGGQVGGGGTGIPPPPVTCTDSSVTTTTVVSDPVTTPSFGKQHRFHGSGASNSVVTDSFATPAPSLARKSVVTDSLVASGTSSLQRFHKKKNKGGGGGSGGSGSPPPPSGTPCDPGTDPCVTDPASCNIASNGPPRQTPEPGTLALVGLGLGALALLRRRTGKA